MKRASLALTLFTALALLTACGGTSSAAAPTAAAAVPVAPAVPTTAPTAEPTQPPTAEPTAAPTQAPTQALTQAKGLTITDDLGRSVTLDVTPQRIVSLAPSVTEILFAVGAGAQVVGDTKYCNYPPEADALPEIGGYSAKSISVEAVVGLKPDLVIAGTASQKTVVESLEKLGVPVIALAPGSVDAVYESITQIGAITGHGEQAATTVAEMQQRISAVTAKVATLPAEKRPTVFWEVFDDPLTTSGPGTFIGQLIELAGATNVFADATEAYPQVSLETVVERNPAVILGPVSQREKLTPELIGQRPGWATIAAVQGGRVYLLDGDIVSRPGPRLAEALEALALALYPELFA